MLLERRRTDAADHLRHGRSGLGLRPGRSPPVTIRRNGTASKSSTATDRSCWIDETRQIEAETNALTPNDVIKLELDIAPCRPASSERGDFTNEYVDAVEALIDLEAIRKAGLKVIVDPMYGVGQLTLGTVLTEARCRVTFIHERHNPLFGGRSPAPNLEALRMLSSQMEGWLRPGTGHGRRCRPHRHRGRSGEYISVNDVLLLLYWYLHEVRGERGGVVRNLSTTHLLDRLADKHGRTMLRSPGGLQAHRYSMVEHNARAGRRILRRADDSRAHSGQGWHLRVGPGGGDAGATGRKSRSCASAVYAITGTALRPEESIPATPEMRIAVPRRLKESVGGHIGPYPVDRISHIDGTKMFLENDNWALLRFSGTEPVLRLSVEADTEEKAAEMMQWLRQFVTAKA